MSIKIGHASIDENGKISGGKAGDSTGREVCIRQWYSKPWQYYLECTDTKIADTAAVYMEQICNNNNVGYDQSERLTLYNQLKTHKNVSKLTPCECDCSSLVACCYIMAGLNINPACTTRNLRSALLSTGKFTTYSDPEHIASDKYAKRGGIFLKEGSHVVMALDNGAQIIKTGNTMTTPEMAIDVSSYQGTIDWKRVKQFGINYAILRGVIKNGNLDSTFEKNYSNAIQNGIKIIGVYQYSYALNEDMAQNDAINMIKNLNGKKIDIWLDLEWSEQRKLGKDKVTSIAKSYINTCRASGYICHIYSNLDWYKNVYNATELENLGCKFWIARYPAQDAGIVKDNLKPNIGEYMWQYSSKGSVDGISGNVDMNMIYGNIESSAVTFPMSNNTAGDPEKYIVSAKGKVFNCTKLNMRKTPEAATNNIATVLNADEEVYLMLRTDNGWYKVKTKGGLVGYVSGKYIAIT